MKKITVFLLAAFICGLLAVPGVASTEEPVIILQPQSPNYPEYSVAIYTVKAEGTNLQAYWYMEWMGKTYCISDIGGAMQDWEMFAGESYGARKVDDNTFIYVFEGIEYDLDGAYIWCEIEDGHYSVTSQKNRISVGNENMPPEILSIPTELTVEQGDMAEIRCVAKSSDGSELSFLWYETDTGKREDIYAVNRGEETTDYLICDTETVGTRNYICQVSSANGGITYSSLVPVTVTEKQPVTPPDDPVDDPVDIPDDPGETEQPGETDRPGDTEQPGDTDEPSREPVNTPASTTDTTEQNENQDFLVWGIVLIAVGAAGVGFLAALVVIKRKAN